LHGYHQRQLADLPVRDKWRRGRDTGTAAGLRLEFRSSGRSSWVERLIKPLQRAATTQDISSQIERKLGTSRDAIRPTIARWMLVGT
jgi:hypothetical protein